MPVNRTANRYAATILLSASVVSVCGIFAAWSASPGPSQQAIPQNGTVRQTAPDEQSLRLGQTQEEADAKSAGCLSCHTSTDTKTMHRPATVRLGCTDCHGGDPTVSVSPGLSVTSSEYKTARDKAHPKPKVLSNDNSGNPVRVYTDWLKENWDYVKFVNPGGWSPRPADSQVAILRRCKKCAPP